ncbi:MAG: DNA mismatch repair endonuclease MutL [Anaerobiospirillum succiniciproducens]|uniref:DNA mismatch repair endonuclease MutL n=1 Tax=Anaerobiospirillum succiniciproducens TaxID=13335 RepID=UPI002A75CC9F|nr:DNA mismatch repair endonuclease MutL [Anaerobiospirillum succiniciproducens]MDY2797741.1 DNA mismatch repair endonuclease MutL [Anaerobiospirillum succiniciproducens]
MGIKRLSVQLANQIAAGEVVERPASVVKELLENAVDAGASLITLEIRSSGKTLIKVTDNGKGIVADELPLALAPHATSKIETLEDLSAIRTLGFRGEALASIASVSRLTLISRTADAEHAFQVHVEGAEQHPVVEPAIHNQGTSVIVRELFFNTPARRRFLKSDKTEFNHIKELITKIALVNCDTEFKFISDGKTVFSVPAHGKAKMAQRIAALLGSEFKHNLLSFDNTDEAFVRKYNHYQSYMASRSGGYVPFHNSSDYENSDDLERDSLNSKLLQIHGVLLRPPANRSLPDRLLTFLNGRCIADRTVNHAIREAFLNVLQGNSEVKPCVRGVIFLQCDPHIVDVNVHPRKDEVRFHNSNLIHDCIRNNIYAVLATSGLNDKNASQTSFELEDDFGNEEELTVHNASIDTKASVAATSDETTTKGFTHLSSSAQEATALQDNSAFAKEVVSYLERTQRPMHSQGNAHDEEASLCGRLADFGAIRTGLGELEAIRGAQKVSAPFIEAFKESKLKKQQGTLSPNTQTSDESEDEFKEAASSNTLAKSYGLKTNMLKVEPNIGKARGYQDEEAKSKSDNDLSMFITEDGAEDDSISSLIALQEEFINEQEHRASASSQGDHATSQSSFASKFDAHSLEQSSQGTISAKLREDAGTVANVTAANIAADKADADESCSLGAGEYQEHGAQNSSAADELESSDESGRDLPSGGEAKGHSDQSAAVRALYGASGNGFKGRSIYEKAEAANRFERMTIDNVSSMLDALNDGTEDTHKINVDYSGTLSLANRRSNIKFLHLVAADVALIMADQRYFMVRLSELYFNLLMDKYLLDVAKDQVRTKELTMPFSIRTDSIIVKAFKRQDVLCAALRCGFSVKSSQARGCIDILGIPEFISGSNLALVALNALQLISAGTDAILSEGQCPEQLAYNLSRCKAISINTEYDAKELTEKLSSAEQLILRAKDLSVKEVDLFSIASQMLS